MCLLVTVGVVQHMSHGEEGVAEYIRGNRPVFGVHQQHSFQQKHKLSAVGLLCMHVAGVGAHHQVHLSHTISDFFIYMLET